MALAVGRHGVPRLRAPDDAERTGRTRRARGAGGRERAGGADLPQGPRARAGVPRELRSEGKTVAEISLEPDLDWERAPAARRWRPCAPASTSSTRRVFVDDGWRGVADFLVRVGDAVGARQLELRGARHEARAQRQAGLHPAALLLRRADRRGSRGGRRSGSTCCSARARRRASGRRSSVPTTGASARGLLEFVAPAARHEPYPNDHCGICEFKPLCDAWWDAVDHLCRVAGHPAAADRAARRCRDHDARRARARAGGARRRRGWPPETFAKIREQAELQLWAREHGRDRFVLLQPQPDAGFALLPEPSAGRPLLRLRGQPVLGSRTAASSTCGASSTPSGASRRLGIRPRDRAGGVRAVRRPRARAARALPDTARLPLRRRTRSRRSSG